jgi:3'-5' exoribonuclease
VTSVTNDHLKKLLEVAIDDQRWKRAPAAKQMHHAYLGGLLEHTVNLCRLADAVAKLYPILRRDLLITGAVLHDIGKQDEMSCGTTIEYTTPGELLGHIAIGMLRVAKWMDELEFSPELKLTVLHIIGSHHGNLNFGAIKQPAILEAQVFSNLDGVDAAIGKITALIEKAGTKDWTDKQDFGSPRIYIGPSGLEEK